LLPFTEEVLHPDSRLGMPIWPIELAELEPYYLEVQKVMGVSTSPFSDELLKEFKCEIPFQSSRVRLRFSKCAPFVRRNLSMTLGKQCCSVFPSGGSSNPTFTMMALALRLADRLQVDRDTATSLV